MRTLDIVRERCSVPVKRRLHFVPHEYFTPQMSIAQASARPLHTTRDLYPARALFTKYYLCSARASLNCFISASYTFPS